jgi:hypothetical protein
MKERGHLEVLGLDGNIMLYGLKETEWQCEG